MRLKYLLFILIAVTSVFSVFAEEPTPTPVGFDDIGTYYYDIPDNYNMKSCEKIVADDSNDVITADLPLWRCVGGKSSGNNTIDCNKDWVGAYAETVSILNFPLLKFFSAASAAGTEANPVQPMCYYDIQANISDYKEGGDVLNFSGEYPGLLKLTGSAPETNVKYPRLGTASSCSVVEWRNNLNPFMLDIMTFENLPQIPDQAVDNEDDGIFSFLLNLIKIFNIFELSLESREQSNIITVKDELAKIGIDREEVCKDMEVPVTKLNQSDVVTPTPGRDKFVVNQEEEILNFTNTEVCDLQFRSGRVKGAICTFPDGTVFKGDRNTGLRSAGFPVVIECTTDYWGYTTCSCVETEPICGATFACDAPQSQAYEQCRSQQGDVAKTDGDPLLMMSLPGFSEMSLTGGNMMLANTVNVLEQLHSPWEISYGENWGIKMDVKRIAYDLNTKDQEYEPLTSPQNTKSPDLVSSPLSPYIAYGEEDYNYIYKKEFKFDQLGNIAQTQYYFPYLGRLPYLLERISTIHANSLNPETAYTLTKQDQALAQAQAQGRSNVLGLSSELSSELLKPQLSYCADLTEEEQKILDCYGERDNDHLLGYLCENELASPWECGELCIEPGDDSGGVGGNLEDQGELVFPIHDTAGFSITMGFGDIPGPYMDPTYNCYQGTWCHPAVDVANGSSGTNIYAAAKGVVTFAGWSDAGYGNLVIVKHEKPNGENFWTSYAHMIGGSIRVSVGDEVDTSTVLGQLGTTGNSTGPHLHFSIELCEYAAGSSGPKNCYVNPIPLAEAALGVQGLMSKKVLGTETAIDFQQSPNYDPGDTSRIKAIVYHHMGGRFDVARDMFLNPALQKSSHYLIRKDGYILQMVADKDVAWHAGIYFNGDEAPESIRADIVDDNFGVNPNSYSIGIEVESSGEDFTDEQYQALADLSCRLMEDYDIPLDRYNLIGHYEIMKGKVDPLQMDWDHLFQMIEDSDCDVTTNSGSNSSGTSLSDLPYCDNDSNNNPGGIPANLNCLIKRVADSINSWGSKISPEVLYAIAKQETAFNCSPTAGSWSEGVANPGECTGDPNQIAWPNPNSSGYDIRGLTQIMAGTFNGAIANDEVMAKCISDIGITDETVPSELRDEGISSTKYSRKRVGDALCATAILMSKYITTRNGGTPVTEDEWKTGSDYVINVLKEAAADYNAGPGRSGCPGECQTYIRNVPMWFNEALDNDVFANCDDSGDTQNDPATPINSLNPEEDPVNTNGDVYALIYGNLYHEGILLRANQSPSGVIDLMSDYEQKVKEIAVGKNVKSIISINALGKHDSNTNMAEYEQKIKEIITLAKERGYYVMIDVQAPYTSIDAISRVFEEAVERYLIEDNVFFDLDVEYSASAKGNLLVSELNHLISYYYRYREAKGYTNYAVFGLWVFNNSHIVKDTTFFRPGNGAVIAMYDGQNGNTSNCSTKINGYSSMVNYLSSLQHGFLFFDQSNDINNAFSYAAFDKDGCSEQLIYDSISNVKVVGTW
ncbi:MAG TPA: N-acetylmuramoyl-L-alanine amidase [Candidatus Dojkabacteria bacterium]|nr:N-acetylmuramoyl-L-alanine amidase [Candidatus Dojkabacteria bacterium]